MPKRRQAGDSPEASSPEAKKRTAFIRFRVTADELDLIRRAACLYADDIERELEQRGLPRVFLGPLRSPAEWARYIALDAARKRNDQYQDELAAFLKTPEGQRMRREGGRKKEK
jgi:hypothetical protein